MIKYLIFEYIHNKTKNAAKYIRESIYVDGLIGLMLIILIFSSGRSELMIQDTGNLMKVVLASFLHYFALKISLNREGHYYLFVVYSSLNFVFITLFDYLINGRPFTLGEFGLIASCSLFSIFSFIQGSALKSVFSKDNVVME
jgi:hypothetical protein